MVFALAGLAYVRYVLPRFNDAVGFPAWHESRWAKRWNYAIPLGLLSLGAVATLVGLIGWAAGWTFG